MEKYNVGDIVKLKLLQGDDHYYMITGVTDLTKEGSNRLDVDYDIYLMYPIIERSALEATIHEELELVAKFESRDYKTIMKYISNKRSGLGMPLLPKEIKGIVFGEEPAVAKKSVKQVKKPFGMSEINAIMEDNTGQEQVDLYVDRMNIHLGLLYEALQEGDEEQIEFNETKLKEVRQTLIELEYFPLAKRRKGTHTRVK